MNIIFQSIAVALTVLALTQSASAETVEYKFKNGTSLHCTLPTCAGDKIALPNNEVPVVTTENCPVFKCRDPQTCKKAVSFWSDNVKKRERRLVYSTGWYSKGPMKGCPQLTKAPTDVHSYNWNLEDTTIRCTSPQCGNYAALPFNKAPAILTKTCLEIRCVRKTICKDAVSFWKSLNLEQMKRAYMTSETNGCPTYAVAPIILPPTPKTPKGIISDPTPKQKSGGADRP